MPRPFIVAEISANHLGEKSRAEELMRNAKKSGASAVKLQTYKPETMTLNLPEFRVSGDHNLWGGKSLFELYSEAMTPWEWHADLFELGSELEIPVFSSPFDREAVDFLEDLGCPFYKIASLETGDVDLISYVASTGKPIIISTGASTLEEIRIAVETVREFHDQITLLVCTSSYPTLPTDAHLHRMGTLRNLFEVDTGFSDHTLGLSVPIAAVALGASIIEKHLTISRSDGGHDSAFSIEPAEFKMMVDMCNEAFDALGGSEWLAQDSEAESRRLRRSLYITKYVKRGDIVTRENVKPLRPNTGGSILDFHKILGKSFNKDYSPGEPATLDCVN